MRSAAYVSWTIISDDVAYPTVDLMAENNAYSLAVQTILSQYPSISMFTAAGNYNQSYWEGVYAPTSLTSFGIGPAFTCPANGQVDYYVNSFNGNSA